MRTIVRVFVVTLAWLALFVGIPLAVACQWPALVLAAILWAIVFHLYRKNTTEAKRRSR